MMHNSRPFLWLLVAMAIYRDLLRRSLIAETLVFTIIEQFHFEPLTCVGR